MTGQHFTGNILTSHYDIWSVMSDDWTLIYIYMHSRKKDYVMTLLRMWRGEKIRVARINSLRGNPPLYRPLNTSF